MIEVSSVENMKASDKKTIESGTPSLVLMKRAAQGIFDAAKWHGNIAIVAGPGNNGGDGYALAVILKDKGYRPRVYSIGDKLTLDAKYYYDECQKNGIEIREYKRDDNFCGYSVVVDCIFGIGFKGEPQGLYLDAIEKINSSGAYVVSADINSGLNGDNGLCVNAVKSDVTVAIGSYKTGHFLNMAKDYIKELKRSDIGIQLMEKPYFLAEARDFIEIFPKRLHHSHKGSYGKTVIIGGSIEYSGAVRLAAMGAAALSCGCGLATLAVPRSVAPAVMGQILESTLFMINDENGRMLFDKEILDKALHGATSVVCGSGWGDVKDGVKIISHILQNYAVTLILDADGLNAVSKERAQNILKNTACKVILTPHVKEFSRLTGKEIKDILENPIESAKSFSKEYNVTVLLKGTSTVVTDGEDVIIVDKGTPAMAKGGSGDVLAGMIGGIGAFSKEKPLRIAAAGAYINGRAGELAASEQNEYSVIASDLIKNVNKAVSEIIN